MCTKIKDKEDEVLRIKNMSQMEKKKYKKQQELEAANAAKDPLGDFRKKHDLEGEEFRNSKPLVEANLVAKTLVHTTTPCSQLAYQSAVALLDFYIETSSIPFPFCNFAKIRLSRRNRKFN